MGVAPLPVYLEVGTARAFASALDWPGWSRGGKGEAAAIGALVAAGPRYAAVMRAAGLELVPPSGADPIEVVERLKGGSGTDFGVPSVPPTGDDRPVDEAELARMTAILRAAWETFDASARAAAGVVLRKGPRGGGRDLGKIVGHVLEAEEVYVQQLGGRPGRAQADASVVDRMAAIRARALTVLAARVHGDAVENASAVRSPWLPRTFARRSAWHVLDHAWEIEDRAAPAPSG